MEIEAYKIFMRFLFFNYFSKLFITFVSQHRNPQKWL